MLNRSRKLVVKQNRLPLLIFIFLLGTPISIFTLLDNELPLSTVAIVLSVPFLFFVPNIREKVFLACAFILAFVAILFTYFFVADVPTLRPLISLVFFFQPYLLFFPGYVLVKTEDDLRFVISKFAALFVWISIAITLGLFLEGQPVRTVQLKELADGAIIEGSALAGDLLGFPLYGTWGVHSLADFYVTMFAVIILWLFFGSNLTWRSILFYSAGGLFAGYLVLGSVYREAILGVIFLMILIALAVLTKPKRLSLLITLGVFVIVGAIIVWVVYQDRLVEQMATFNIILERSLIAVETRDIDMLVSGQLSLVWYALLDILRNPIFGTGFYGYSLYGIERIAMAGSEAASSTHNQYLTAIWKMGLLPAAFYFCFLGSCLLNLYKLKRSKQSSLFVGLWILMLVYALVLCMAWDVLLVPLIGSFITFLLGCATGIYYENRCNNRPRLVQDIERSKIRQIPTEEMLTTFVPIK